MNKELLFSLFKSLLDVDAAPVVICDKEGMVVYMNPSSLEHYHVNLVGRSIYDCHNAASCEKIKRVVAWFEKSGQNNQVYTYHNDKEEKDVYMIALRDETGALIGFYEKHVYKTPERGALYDMP
ncbi:MAG: PAS domain-containing protein [Clostridia bacterium]|nr:PAS domain-containing protein [Clostridia bacterium]MBQ8399623.1 PAS domain-containing protein [Clostridia bacterium]